MMKFFLRTTLGCAAAVCLLVGTANAELVHHWNVEGDTAPTLTDSVGGIDLLFGPRDGSLSASAAAPGIGSTQGFTTVAEGDATSANADDLFMASSFSLALWTQRVEDSGSAQASLLGVIDNNTFQHNYQIRSTSDGSTLAFFSRDDTGTTIFLQSPEPDNLADLGWHHVAATFDWSGTVGTAATAKLYVDGVETVSGTEAAWNGWDVADMTQGGIGQEGFTPISNFDDLRIYDHALSAAEVQALVPEPNTFVLLAFGLGGCVGVRRMRQK